MALAQRSFQRLPQISDPQTIDTGGFFDAIRHYRNEASSRDYPRYRTEQRLEIAENILLYQNPDGGWPKNIDPLRILNPAEVKGLKEGSISKGKSTLDNDNTYPQIRYLSELFRQTKQRKYLDSARRGLTWIFETQRPSGGWRGSDVDAITFNDNVMAGTLEILKQIVDQKSPFEWVSVQERVRATQAMDRGIRCVLNCQIKQNGKLTAWGQQHDHHTFDSSGARTYEFPCITAGETVGVIEFLMEIEKPSPDIIQSIEAAVAWLNRVRIDGIRIKGAPLETPVKIGNRTYRNEPVVVKDPTAPSLWARYYDLKTNEPFFANRDGIRVKTFAEIELERRTGYAWYGEWPNRLFESKYPEWKKRIGR